MTISYGSPLALIEPSVKLNPPPDSMAAVFDLMEQKLKNFKDW